MTESAGDHADAGSAPRRDSGQAGGHADGEDAAEVYEEMLAQGHEWAAQAGGRGASRHHDAAQQHRQAARRKRAQTQSAHDDAESDE